MCTIVIHGVGARDESWWILKRPGGFLDALAQGMRQGGREPDIWTIGERPLADYAPPPPPPDGEPFEHLDGHFRWCGQPGHEARLRDGMRLARYLGSLSRVHPSEPINIVAHGHGANLVKIATHYVQPGTLLGRVVFLGSPFCEIVEGGQQFPYRLSAQSISRDVAGAAPVMNLYSREDTAQIDWTDSFPQESGCVVEPDGRGSDFRMSPTFHAYRVDPDPYTQYAYDNVELPTRMGLGGHVHQALHGPTVGLLIGYWFSRWPELSGRDCLRNFGIDAVTDPNPG